MPKRYLFIGVCISVLLHGALIAVMLISKQTPPKERKRPPMNIVNAKVVEIKAKSKAAAPKQAKKKPKKIDLAAKRKAQEKKKQQALAAKQKKEKKKREEAQKKKREKQKQLDEQKRKELERKKQQEQERQKIARAEALKKEKEAQAQLDEEYAKVAMSIEMAIQRRVGQKFVAPPSARKGMSAVISVQLVPTGRIVSAAVKKSSGNAAFDRAARQAVLDVEQFPEIKTMPRQLFERDYRQFSINVNPDGLRL